MPAESQMSTREKAHSSTLTLRVRVTILRRIENRKMCAPMAIEGRGVIYKRSLRLALVSNRLRSS